MVEQRGCACCVLLLTSVLRSTDDLNTGFCFRSHQFLVSLNATHIAPRLEFLLWAKGIFQIGICVNRVSEETQENAATSVVHANLLAYFNIRKRESYKWSTFAGLLKLTSEPYYRQSCLSIHSLALGKSCIFLTRLDFRASYAGRILSKKEVFHAFMIV